MSPAPIITIGRGCDGRGHVCCRDFGSKLIALQRRILGLPGAWNLFQPINPFRVFGKKLLLPLAGFLRHDFPGELDPAAETRGQVANRPVAAEQNSVPAEAFDTMLNKRLDGCRGHALRIAVGDHAGDLTGEVWKLSEFTDVFAP